MTDMKLLVIMRGLPGSGKSTLAKEICGEIGVIVSTDDFFYRNGHYSFDAKKLPAARQACYETVVDGMLARMPLLILDNPNIKRAWFEKYLVVAEEHGYKTWECVVGSFNKENLETYFKRCVHGVSMETLIRYSFIFEP
jgi:predicted kinase